MPYVILRTAKLTSLGNIGGSAQHNFRERETPNANPELTPRNRTNGAQSSREVLEKVKERLETVPTVRKNGVLAIEYLITASPEWFERHTYQGTGETFFDSAEQWLKRRHGAENVVAVTRQYDETTPHICAYVVPIDPRGKLNCSHFLDGREKLSQMQTDFAEQVGQQFGLERGIEGSKASHKTIKQHYTEIQKRPQEAVISPESVEPRTYKPVGLVEKLGLVKRVESPEEIARRLTKAVQTVYEPALQAASQYHAEKAANEARGARLAELRATATQVREIPLNGVLERLGAIHDPSDRHNWRTPSGRVSVDGSRFFNHDTGKGGGGAIDLVMAQTETDYKGALNWLANEFGTAQVLADSVARLKPSIEALAEKPSSIDPMKAHQTVPGNWEKVKKYLVETRRLDAQKVENLHERGLLYADKFKNVVFVLWNNKGLSIRGTGEKPFHGVRGEKVPFIITASDETNRKVAFVESPIDAISLRELGFNGRIVAMVGSSTKLARFEADIYRGRGLTVVGAFDNDRAGEAMCRALGEHKRLRPNGKDWNADLKAQKLTPEEHLALKAQKHQKERDSGMSL